MKLIVGTYNLSAAAVNRKPQEITQDLKELMALCHVVLIQEAGQAASLLNRFCAETGNKIYYGTGQPGQSSTPILYRQELDVIKRQSRLLTRRTNVGSRGAGPSTLKAKWLNMIKFRFNGRGVWVCDMHTSPSIYIPVRKRLVKRQFQRAAFWLRLVLGIIILGGDLNSEPDNSVRNPLERIGLRSTQVKLGYKNTMGRRKIDDLYVTNDNLKVKPIRNAVLPGASDHHAYLVEFDVLSKRKK